MKEIRATLRLQNNLLIQRRVELNLTPRAFSEAVGLSYGLYLQYEGLKLSPVTDGNWRPSALKIADYHGLPPEELWTDAVLSIAKAKATVTLDVQQLARLVAPTPTAEEVLGEVDGVLDLRGRVKRTLALLSPTEEQVLRKRFGIGEREETLRGVAGDRQVSTTRIQQIQKKALRRLRHPSASVILKDYA